jgi:hypothetical protein
MAVRLVLAGKVADDAAVTAVRDAVQRVHAGDESARREYASIVG